MPASAQLFVEAKDTVRRLTSSRDRQKSRSYLTWKWHCRRIDLQRGHSHRTRLGVRGGIGACAPSVDIPRGPGLATQFLTCDKGSLSFATGSSWFDKVPDSERSSLPGLGSPPDVDGLLPEPPPVSLELFSLRSPSLCLPSFGDALLLPAAWSNPSLLFGPMLSGTVSRLCGSVTRMAGIWSVICDSDRYE